MKWKNLRDLVTSLYGVAYNSDPDDDECFYCPHCGEPIYEDDFPIIDAPMCPICEEEYN